MGKHRGSKGPGSSSYRRTTQPWHRMIGDGPMRRAMVAALLDFIPDRPDKQAIAEQLEQVIYDAVPDRADYIKGTATSVCPCCGPCGMIDRYAAHLTHTLSPSYCLERPDQSMDLGCGSPSGALPHTAFSSPAPSRARLTKGGSKATYDLSRAGSISPACRGSAQPPESDNVTSEQLKAVRDGPGGGFVLLARDGCVAIRPTFGGAAHAFHMRDTPGPQTSMRLPEVLRVRLSKGQHAAALHSNHYLDLDQTNRWPLAFTGGLVPRVQTAIQSLPQCILGGEWRLQHPGSSPSPEATCLGLQILQLPLMWLWFHTNPAFQEVAAVVEVMLQHRVLPNIAQDLLLALQTASPRRVLSVWDREGDSQADLCWCCEAFTIGAAGLLQWVLLPTSTQAPSQLTQSERAQLMAWYEQLLEEMADVHVFGLLTLHTVAVSMERAMSIHAGSEGERSGEGHALASLSCGQGLVIDMERDAKFLAALLAAQYNAAVAICYPNTPQQRCDLRQLGVDLLFLSTMALRRRCPEKPLSAARVLCLAHVTDWVFSAHTAGHCAASEPDAFTEPGRLSKFPGLLGWQLQAVLGFLQFDRCVVMDRTQDQQLHIALPSILSLTLSQLAWVMFRLDSDELPRPEGWMAPEIGPLCCQALYQAMPGYSPTTRLRIIGRSSALMYGLSCQQWLVAAARWSWPTGSSPSHQPSPGVAACSAALSLLYLTLRPEERQHKGFRQGLEVLVCLRKHLGLLVQRCTENPDLLLGSTATSLQAKHDAAVLLTAGSRLVITESHLFTTGPEDKLNRILAQQVHGPWLSMAELVVGALEHEQQRQADRSPSSLTQTLALHGDVVHVLCKAMCTLASFVSVSLHRAYPLVFRTLVVWLDCPTTGFPLPSSSVSAVPAVSAAGAGSPSAQQRLLAGVSSARGPAPVSSASLSKGPTTNGGRPGHVHKQHQQAALAKLNHLFRDMPSVAGVIARSRTSDGEEIQESERPSDAASLQIHQHAWMVTSTAIAAHYTHACTAMIRVASLLSALQPIAEAAGPHERLVIAGQCICWVIKCMEFGLELPSGVCHGRGMTKTGTEYWSSHPEVTALVTFVRQLSTAFATALGPTAGAAPRLVSDMSASDCLALLSAKLSAAAAVIEIDLREPCRNVVAGFSAEVQQYAKEAATTMKRDMLQALSQVSSAADQAEGGGSSCSGGSVTGGWSMCCNPCCTNMSGRAESDLPLPCSVRRQGSTAASYCSTDCCAQARGVHV